MCVCVRVLFVRARLFLFLFLFVLITLIPRRDSKLANHSGRASEVRMLKRARSRRNLLLTNMRTSSLDEITPLLILPPLPFPPSYDPPPGAMPPREGTLGLHPQCLATSLLCKLKRSSRILHPHQSPLPAFLYTLSTKAFCRSLGGVCSREIRAGNTIRTSLPCSKSIAWCLV